MDDRPPDELERWRKLRRTGDRDVRDDLIIEHQSIAERCAKRFADRGEQYDDLLQVAMLALVKAVDRFDPDVGSTFPSFAMPTIMGELRRHFRDYTWPMAVPRRAKDLVTALNAAVDTISKRLCRSPTVEEVADELGVAVDQVLETMEARGAYRPTSLQQPIRGVDDESGMREERIGGDDDELVQSADRLTVLAAARSLDPRQRRIVLWRFYEGCTQQEIGERLGIGQVQVSRLLRDAFTDMRSHIERRPRT